MLAKLWLWASNLIGFFECRKFWDEVFKRMRRKLNEELRRKKPNCAFAFALGIEARNNKIFKLMNEVIEAKKPDPQGNAQINKGKNHDWTRNQMLRADSQFPIQQGERLHHGWQLMRWHLGSPVHHRRNCSTRIRNNINYSFYWWSRWSQQRMSVIRGLNHVNK